MSHVCRLASRLQSEPGAYSQVKKGCGVGLMEAEGGPSPIWERCGWLGSWGMCWRMGPRWYGEMAIPFNKKPLGARTVITAVLLDRRERGVPHLPAWARAGNCVIFRVETKWVWP